MLNNNLINKLVEFLLLIKTNKIIKNKPNLQKVNINT